MPSKPPENKNSSKNEFARGIAMLSQIGIMMVVCIGIGVFIGHFLDNFFGTSPWLLLVFSFMGVGAAFKYIFDLAKRM